MWSDTPGTLVAGWRVLSMAGSVREGSTEMIPKLQLEKASGLHRIQEGGEGILGKHSRSNQRHVEGADR